MHVNFLDHVNIVTDDLAGAARFYEDLFDLEVRNGPPPSRPDQVRWVYDGNGRAIVHLNARGAFQVFNREAPAGPTTGAVHHVALNCEGFPDMLDRLKARDLPYQINDVASIGLKQIFVVDPNNVLLELNFFQG